MKTSETNNGTSTSNATQTSETTPAPAPTQAAPASTSTSSAQPAGTHQQDIGAVELYTPRVQEVGGTKVNVKYGESSEVLRISDTETVSIDKYFFVSPTNLRLKHIKAALSGMAKQGAKLPDGTSPDGANGQAWFNDHVRDPFHKVLKYAARQSLEKGKPVALAFTRRITKSGETITTANHKFEFVTKLPEPAAVAQSAVQQLADQAAANAAKATEQSGARARKQGGGKGGKKNKPLTPVITPEVGNRIDALIAANEAAKANGAPEAAPAAAAATEAVQK